MIRDFSQRHSGRLVSKEEANMYEQLHEDEIAIKQHMSDTDDGDDEQHESQFVSVNPSDSTKKQLKALQNKLDSFDSKLEVVMRQQAQTLSFLKQILSKKIRIKPKSYVSEFPLMNPQALERMNEKIQSTHNVDLFIDSIKQRMGDKGLTKNFERLFDMSLILEMNYDGIRNKIALKKYSHLVSCIFEAVKKDGDHKDEFITELRNAIRLSKNRHFKKTSMERKKEYELKELQESRSKLSPMSDDY